MSEEMTFTPTPAFHWLPPRWIGGLFRVLQFVVQIAGWTVAYVCSYIAADAWWSITAPGLLFPIAFWFVAVAVHELGHLAGARIGGMAVHALQVGPLQFKAERRGWRLRGQRLGSRLHGYLMAFPNPDRPLRQQTMVMVAGGPLANLLVAVVLAIISVNLDSDAYAAFLMGLAVLNLAAGAANLLPTQRSFASDGLQLIRWLKGIDEDAPELLMGRLNGLAVSGVTADQLPSEWVARLDTLPAPGPMVRLWFRLKAYQNQGEWAQAAALAVELDTHIAEVPIELEKELADFVGTLRCEIAFSNAMVAGRADRQMVDGLSRDIDWWNPVLRPRCQALIAALEGNTALAHALLKDAEALAARSIDRASQESEANIRQAILAKLSPMAGNHPA